VRVARGSGKYLYLDTALTGRATFEAALEAAERGLSHYQPEDVSYIRISEARRAGIFPLPEAGFSDGGDEIVLSSTSGRKATAELKDATNTPRR
jgi:hypothetical protein